ncbi:MAG: methylenetetrahydrofolate--tRNA-(uracil(54)-C(5))-methyltransferase (FADH(2)-oxidizing) TrmFO, partial [Oscillospiraceae bacterium]|nr:methylenetetrahydrofolate--tRNA-(uracil(54)-C(5))-methyltransferase (FADH(2)-oxidizing) TrmFO [Oscillospiraceae bacterium]
MNDKKITVIGAGLAGCEAAWQLAKAGLDVELWEMKPQKFTPAHKYNGFAELVCSNSLKASRVNSAAGLLKEEMRRLGSLTVPCAEETAVPAGGALAVDREKFSDLVTEKIMSEPRITVKRGEVSEIPEGNVIIATGPLTSGGLAESIETLCGGYLSFHDAAAPIVTYESLDKEKIFFAARYGRGDDDYINCPFTKEEYTAFWQELKNAESAPLHDFDKPRGKDDFTVYEGCMPIEVLAKRGEETMRYGAMKPVGLSDPVTGKRPYAVVQLRKENGMGTLYNIVGF